MAIGCRSHLLDRGSPCSAQRARPPLHVPFVGSRAVAGVEQASQISGRLVLSMLSCMAVSLKHSSSGDDVIQMQDVFCVRPAADMLQHTPTLRHTHAEQCNLWIAFRSHSHGGCQKPLIGWSAEGSVTRGLHVPGCPSHFRRLSSSSIRRRTLADPPTVSISRGRQHGEQRHAASRTKKRALDPLLVPALLALVTPP